MPVSNTCWSRRGSDRPTWWSASAGWCRGGLRSATKWKQHRDQSALRGRQRRQRLHAQDAARAARRFRGADGGGWGERMPDGRGRAPRYHSDGPRNAQCRWLGSHTKAQGQSANSRHPVIALSAHALAGEREKALAAGCNEFDTKPIEFDRLVATLRRVLAHRK